MAKEYPVICQVLPTQIEWKDMPEKLQDYLTRSDGYTVSIHNLKTICVEEIRHWVECLGQLQSIPENYGVGQDWEKIDLE